jgi:light-regulated signal transduction histidine kinase (bacteriophytochrome)
VAAIQPHGVLLAVSATDWTIMQASNNTQPYLNRSPSQLIGQPLSTLLSEAQVAEIAQCANHPEERSHYLHLSPNPSETTSETTSETAPSFDCILHRSGGAIVLELEPRRSDKPISFLSVHAWMRGTLAKLHAAAHPDKFLNQVAQEVQTLTGFDRVLVYQFDVQGCGQVLAEARSAEAAAASSSSYLGLHYPATDIPEASRQLYLRHPLRFIPDLQAAPVELVPACNPLTDEPLDLSLSILRSVDPCCVEFHTNMGAAALLAISLVRDRQLWGLISCHHRTPKSLSYEIRTACEFLGQIVSWELAAKVNQEEWDYQTRLKVLQTEFLESIAQAEKFPDLSLTADPHLLALVGASGAVVCLDEKIARVGETPPVETIAPLIAWTDHHVCDNLFYTDCLPKLYPPAEADKDIASGLLVLRISQVRRYYILWFRPEAIRTVTWAGNPEDSLQHQPDGSVVLCPRRSFAQWQEAVRWTSLPWQACEIENALGLRNAIVGIILKQADELARINKELTRSNQELESFAYVASHDLKEPLRGIHNYAMFLLEDNAEQLDAVGIDRLHTLVRLTQRMDALIDVLLQFSRLGQAQLNFKPTDLNVLVHRAINVLQISRRDASIEIRIPRPLPIVCCDSVLVQELLANLIGNAFKYNDKPQRWVEIGYQDEEEPIESRQSRQIHAPIFYVRDNGIGIRERHLKTVFRLFKRLHAQNMYGGGTGAGLTIAQKIVERHGGRIWVESTYGAGSTFYFMLD